MRMVTAMAGQSLLDVALMACGSADYAHEIAKANSMGEDAVMSSRMVLMVPSVGARVVGEMERNGVVPVSGKRFMRDGIGVLSVGGSLKVD